MRNRYLDLLRAAAIVRVIVYHLFGWPWLSIVLPAMGIMFALAGSLTAASLDKRAAGQVITSRLRRLLPPLWLLGLIAVPVMIVAGWRHETDGDHPFSAARLLLWVLPVGDPPGSDLGIDAWEPLWYIRAYVWFVLLSPALFAFYRRAGWLAVASPIVLLGLLDITGFSLPDTADAALWDFVTYGACWVAGFAHHDGRLARLKPWLAVPLAVVLGAAALYWLRGHQGEDPWDLNDVSESQALWSIAFVLLALRWQPPMDWLARARPLDRAVTLLNNRAVTVYLWHNIAIAAVWPVLTVLALDDSTGETGAALDLLTALTLTVVAVLAFGWAEDLAARRRPRLWPATAPEPHPSTDPAPAPSEPLPPALGRRPSAAAAINRLPASWPPPRTPRQPAPAGPPGQTYGATDRAIPAPAPDEALQAVQGQNHSSTDRAIPARAPSEAHQAIPGEVHGGPDRAIPARAPSEAHQAMPGQIYSGTERIVPARAPGEVQQTWPGQIYGGTERAVPEQTKGGAEGPAAGTIYRETGWKPSGGANGEVSPAMDGQRGGAHQPRSARSYGGVSRSASEGGQGAAESAVRPGGPGPAGETPEWFKGRHDGSDLPQ